MARHAYSSIILAVNTISAPEKDDKYTDNLCLFKGLNNFSILFVLNHTKKFFMGIFKSKPTSANKVDIEKYAGKWYEIARYPNSFEKNCDYATATYSIKKKLYSSI